MTEVLQPTPANMSAGRQSAAGVLIARADQLRQKAARLEILAHAVKEMGRPAEDILNEVLWDAFHHR